MARTFGTLYFVGGVVGVLILLVGEATDRNDTVIAGLSMAAVVLGVFTFIAYDRLPSAFFQAMLVLGTLMITGATAGASHGAEGVYGFFYVWVVFLAFLFFTPRQATAQAAFAAIAYAAVLIARDADFTVNLMIAGVVTIGTTGAIMGLLMARIEQIAAGFASQARTDPVTAIANRRDFDRRFEAEIARARRSGQPIALLICDLDRFKAVNDALGHEEGDAALRRAAAAIADSLRSRDALARLGGEEFGVILPDTDAEAAQAVGERVRTAVSAEFASYDVQLTASCGAACTNEAGIDTAALYRAADVALYIAKREGRNRTAAYPGPSAAEPPA